MGLGREEIVETTAPPVFQPGEKVMANRHVKNDGTYPRKDIGEILGSSPRTVNKHLEHIFEKLGVETRTAAANLASSKMRGV